MDSTTERLAREAGFDVNNTGIYHPDTDDQKRLDKYVERLIAIVRADERRKLEVRYEVRQQVSSVKKSWQEVVFSTEFERVARDCYSRLAGEHEAEYFELVRVLSGEDCLEFTAHRAAIRSGGE